MEMGTFQKMNSLKHFLIMNIRYILEYYLFVFFLKILIFWTQSQNKDQKQEKLSVKKGKQRRKKKENAFHNLLIKLVSFGLIGWE